MNNTIVFLAVFLINTFSACVIAEEENFSPFGIGSCHTNNRSAEDYARWIPQMEQIGIRYYRSCQTSWSSVEPLQGDWKWDILDQQMEYLQKHQMIFGGTLIGNPQWNTKDKPRTLPVNNIKGWSQYVTQLVGHCKGKIKYWEVWNEPPNFTGKNQTPADYAKIVVSAYDAAKAADPHCLVGLAAKSVHINYLEQVIKAGAKDHFDFITLHPYEVLGGIADNVGSEPLFMHIVPTTRKMLAAQNPAKLNVPIIFTELGCDLSKGEDVQAQVLVKAYSMSIAQGVTCVQWFEGMDGDSGPLGLLDRNAQPRQAYRAMAQMIRHLGQHPEYLGWIKLDKKTIGFLFQGRKGPVLIAWSQKGTSSVVHFSKQVEVLDPLTGHMTAGKKATFSAAPLFLRNVPAKWIRQARFNKKRPLMWGGDFSRANAVSLTMGETPIEKGLHSLSGEKVAKAVIGYGGSARHGNLPGGNLFVVNPEFMSYTTEPIEITVVVRRNEANENSGFKLVYESNTGFKTAGGWYTVPDNKKWHTVKWKIDDAQFVGYWGYNFSLVSDGDVYNKYYIKSVTVKKLSR